PFTTRGSNLYGVRAYSRGRPHDRKLGKAIQIGGHHRAIECSREVIPSRRRDARTDRTIDNCASESVRGFEVDSGPAEPERHVVSRTKPNRMFIDVCSVVPVNPESDRPLSEPGYRRAGGDLVINSIELSRTPLLSDHVCCARNRSMMPVSASVLHVPVNSKGLHVIGQYGT